jgi:hypothetical protein
VLDVERLSEAVTKPFLARGREGADLEVPIARRAFAAHDLSEFVVRPTRLQLELLNHWDATPPASEAEKAMIAAAEDLDLDEVERLVGAGANINALGDFDDTALTTAIQAMGRKAGEEGAVNGGEEVVRRFLSLGADVNLFGYDGVDPLISATLSAAPAIVEALLDAGADPNHNAWPDDDLDAVSSALSCASCDAFLPQGYGEGRCLRRHRTPAGGRWRRVSATGVGALGVILDYDASGDLVSLEILDASRRVTEVRRIEFETVGPFPSRVRLSRCENNRDDGRSIRSRVVAGRCSSV